MDVMSYLTGITHAVSAYKTAVQTLDDAKITAATHELTAQLTYFGSEVLSMQKDGVQATQRERDFLTRIHELEDRVRELEKLRAERDRYELVEPYSGTYVLRVKEVSRDGEPEHYLCPGCLDNKAMKSILQFNGEPKDIGTCHSCSMHFRFKDSPPAPYEGPYGGVNFWGR